jgi:Family of unknown function (DUF6232)
MADERVFLNEGGVFVSNSRAVIAGTTYSMANITSVRMGSTPPSQGCAILLLVMGLLMVLASLAAFAQGVGTGIVALLLGGGVTAAAAFWLRSLKPTFHVLTASASGETQALSSKDDQLISRVVAAVSEAIVHRG